MRFLYNPWLLILLAALIFSLGAWQVPLFDEDEGAFAEATREMLESGNYLVTYLNGEPRHDKPILIYWLQGASVLLLGEQELAFRLPSIIAALLWALALYRFTRQTLGRDEAGIATLAFSTALIISLVGKWATADAVLNLFIALTLFDAWRFAEHREAKHGWRIYLWMGLGFLTKGPIAIAIPVAAGLAWMLWSGRLGLLWQLLRQPAGWAAFVIVAAPWYIGNTITPEGRAFLQGFLLEHNLERFTDTREGHGGYLWYYLVATPLVIMPFTGWLPGLLQRLPKVFNAPLDRFLWLWFAVVFVFFSLSATQLAHYIVYGLTPLFVLAGRYYGHFTHRWVVFTPAVLFFAALAILPAVSYRLLALTMDAEPAVLRSLADQVTGLPYAAAAVGGLVVTVSVAMYRRMHPWHGLLLVGLMQALLVSLVIAPAAARLEQTHIRAAGRAAAALADTTVVAFRYHRPSFSVYRGEVTPSRAPAPGEVVFTQASTLADWLAERPLTAQTLFASGNVVLARIGEADAAEPAETPAETPATGLDDVADDTGEPPAPAVNDETGERPAPSAAQTGGAAEAAGAASAPVTDDDAGTSSEPPAAPDTPDDGTAAPAATDAPHDPPPAAATLPGH